MSVAGLKFISIVEAFYPRPKFAGDETREAIWTRTMLQILQQYDEDVLIEAAETIVRIRDPDKDSAYFPKPVECIAACDKVKALKVLRSTPLLESRGAVSKREKREEDLRSWSEDRLELASDLCRGELGQRAAHDGWINALFDYCRANSRLPLSNDEIADLIRSSQRYRLLVEDLKQGEQCSVTRALIKLSENVFSKADERSQQILGGRA